MLHQVEATYTGIDVEHGAGSVGIDLRRDDVYPVVVQHGQHHHHVLHAEVARHGYVDVRVVVRHAEHKVRP